MHNFCTLIKYVKNYIWSVSQPIDSYHVTIFKTRMDIVGTSKMNQRVKLLIRYLSEET